MVAHTRKSGANSPKKLKFKDKIVGKGLTTDALLKKLKVLHKELAELDQENVDTSSLDSVCRELVSSSILLHKDKGVKAYAACCIADLLRLYAPDAPFTAAELRDIFQFFFRQLELGLKGSDSPYYNEYFHLLESLSTVKSVVLICDLPQAEELMIQGFNCFFTLVKQDLAKNIELFMADILTALIDECQVLPQDVLETIMAQFMDKNARMDQPSYRLAVQVCNATSDRLQRHVCQYFTDIIVQHSQSGDFDEVQSAHELIKRLNHSCPSLLHNVVPQLEEELKVEEVQLRQMATQVLGEMFADRVGGELEKKYPTTWALWILRKNDKSSAVRLAFVEGCLGLLQTSVDSSVREEIEESLRSKLLDPDEKVRAAVCKLYSQLDYETALHHVSAEQLRAVSDRMIDRKPSVRQEAVNALGKLYSLAYPEIENNDAAAINHFAWFPEQLLHYLTRTAEIRTLAENVIADYVLPLPQKGDDEVSWTERLLNTMRFMDQPAINTLLHIAGLKSTRPTIFEQLLQCFIQNNGGIIDEDEEAVKKRLAAMVNRTAALFPDPQKAASDLQAFAKLNEQRLYKLMKTCMDLQTDLKSLVKATSEFQRRLEQTSPALVPTMMSLLRKASLWIVNQSSIPTLLKALQRGEVTGRGAAAEKARVAAANAATMMTTISKHCADVYRPHVSELLKDIAEDRNARLVELSLQALASVCILDANVLPGDKRTTERLMHYLSSDNARHAKFATRILANSKRKDDVCTEIIQSISKRLGKAQDEELTVQLSSLHEIVRFVPNAFETKSEAVVSFLLEMLKTQTLESSNNDMSDDSDIEYIPATELSPIARSKELALKILRNRCLVHSQSESAIDIATPVVNLLTAIVEEGESDSSIPEDPRIKAILRLQAAISLLHLATVEVFAPLVSTVFLSVALVIQDHVFGVRLRFLNKLLSLMTARKLPPRFYVILFMTVHDPEDEIKDKARAFCTATYRKCPPDYRLTYFEMIFIRLLHLVAHHPDFEIGVEPLKDMSMYIKMYLELVATADNISLLYHLAQRAKTVRDAESHTYSEHLYVMSELAQELIKRHASARGWSIASYPGKVKLPGDIFKGLPNHEAANKILKTVYLPEDILSHVIDASKPIVKDKPKAERKVSAKRKAPKKPNGTSPKRRKRKPRSDDEDEDDEEEESDSEVLRSRASAGRSSATPSSSEEEDDDEGENDEKDKAEDLGRGARTRAKVKARKQAKRKARTNKPLSD